MIFAAILVYFAKERLIGSDGMTGFAICAMLELGMELALLITLVAKH